MRKKWRYVFITPELAQQWIDAALANPDQEFLVQVMRPIRRSWVMALAELMLTGEFVANDPITLGYLDGQTYIMNGVHRLHAIVTCGISQRMSVEHVDFDSRDELRKYYATLDRGLSRSVKDSFRAYGATETFGLPLSHVDYLVTAVRFIAGGFASPKKPRYHSDSYWLSLARPFVQPFESIAAIASGKVYEKKILRRRAVLSVALVTFLGQESFAREFWLEVLQRLPGVVVAEADPALRLRDYLFSTGVRGGNEGAMKLPQVDSAETMARKTAHFWNKAFKGEKATLNEFGTQAKMRKLMAGPLSLAGCEAVPLPLPTTFKLTPAAPSPQNADRKPRNLQLMTFDT